MKTIKQIYIDTAIYFKQLGKREELFQWTYTQIEGKNTQVLNYCNDLLDSEFTQGEYI